MMTCSRMSSQNPFPAWRRPLHRPLGFSLTEMIITISLLAIVAGIALISMSGTYEASQDALARERLEVLNRGLNKFTTTGYELTFPPRPDSGADEMFVLRSLQYRNPDPARARVGSPYVTSVYNPTVSSEVSDHRLRWTGRLYELLMPGQSGTGLKIAFDSSDMTEAFQFPPNFQTAGR